jgi:hypothetical protein
MRFGMKFGLGLAFRGLMKAANKVLKGAVKVMPNGLAKKLGGRDALNARICRWTGEPVEIASGLVMAELTDFEFPGPIPLRWERKWFSDSGYAGPLGHGWHHAYSFALGVDHENSVIGVRLDDGRVAHFPLLEPGETYFNRAERLTLRREEDAYLLRDADNLTYRFGPATEMIPGDWNLLYWPALRT